MEFPTLGVDEKSSLLLSPCPAPQMEALAPLALSLFTKFTKIFLSLSYGEVFTQMNLDIKA